MSRPKIARKSTSIDMTAMCDVAFLLLSFFILTTKFKPSEAIQVTTPSSVASKVAPDKDVVLVTIDKNGKVFISIAEDGASKKEYIANTLNTTRNLGINVNAFKQAEFWGTSFSQIPAFLALPVDKRLGDALPGISIDTTKGPNELVEWLGIINKAYQGQKMNLLLKGDNNSKFPAFKAVIDAFKKNDFLKFQMITNPENVPVGSELFKDNLKNPAAKA
jgi:biopolymer transport protein ExbD